VGSKSYDLLWGTALRGTTYAHRFIHWVSKGNLGRRFPGGAQVVWITTLGRKSGEWRRTPLLAVSIEGGWGIAGSNAGQEKIPGWVYNVEAHDRGQIEVDDQVFEVVFTRVSGDLSNQIYQGLISQWSAYDMYRRKIHREIPIFLVKPLTAG
jgi:deazaflavin-dependent oxidoreductase (nitroreductase family)